jgi:hypothetical protein
MTHHPTIDSTIGEYLSLALAMERRFPGFVDGYHGPPELKAAVMAAPEPSADELLERAKALQGTIDGAEKLDPRRATFLTAQVKAMVALCRMLAGETLPYTEEVATLFDIEPAHTPEARFDAAIAELDTLLPGEGEVRTRMVEWRNRTIVTPEMARQLIDRIAEETRRRTERLIDLPPVESVEFAMVQDQPWSGYNWFLGGGKSRVEINTDLPIRASGLLDLIAHEAYPGHHTEHSLKEHELYREQGFGEYAIQLINTPECVISEGIATLASGFIFAEGEGERWMAEEIYPLASIPADPEREHRINRAASALRAVGANAALLMHDQGASDDEVVAYHMRYGLDDEERARHRLGFIKSPLWRAYIFTYHAGRDLLNSWLDQAKNETDRAARIRTLMLEPITPGVIAEQVRGASG